ncbi:MAG TPA: hypothetical protein VLE74_01255 [Candidatus Saccharimonadales bacterium]|nr:hypothetical protein [Candidatus Saccharimonadales bacterium]
MGNESREGAPFEPADPEIPDALIDGQAEGADTETVAESDTQPEITGGPAPVEFKQTERVDSLDDAISRGAGRNNQRKPRNKKL